MHKIISVSKLYDRILSFYISGRKRKSEDKKLSVKYRSVCGTKMNVNSHLCVPRWKHHIKKYHIDTRWFEMYHSIWPDANVSDFVPDSFYYAYLDKLLNNYNKASIFDDKNYYDLYFPDVLMPETICRKAQGHYLNSKYEIISKDQAVDLCCSYKKVVLKPSINTCGGKGILIWDADKDSMADLMSYLDVNSDIIAQSLLTQHADLAKLHPSSINSIRIMSMTHAGNVDVLSTIVRMGTNNARVDNTSSGGLSCGVNESGRLNDFAYDIKANRYTCHPQGIKFEDSVIPNYDKCIELVKRLAPRFVGFSRLISWDLSVDVNGEPVLIEANLHNGGINFHQMNNGPVFKEYIDYFLQITN